MFEDETQAESLKTNWKSTWLGSQIAAPFVQNQNLGGAIVEPALQMATDFKPISEIGGMAAAGREMISPQGSSI